MEKKEQIVQIIIATHKKYQMPADSMYLPLQVGAEGKEELGYAKDNTGDNISSKNPSFCELTGLYWAWKNLDAEFIGLVHYRRHFALKKSKDPFDSVLSYKELRHFLKEYELFVPKKRRYYIESLYSHYKHTHYAEQLDATREIILGKYPEYIGSYDKIMKRTYGYMFNMAIMRRKWLNQYCEWLFDILFELENRIDMSELSTFQGRFYGRVSEIIFNVWLDHQIETGAIGKERIKELPCIHMEKVNWWKKGTAFLKAKFFQKRYEGSF
ncbi:MAG: DUF4422 domain-containing protein [Lachnospiraceae bacterium]|nr:DUF4422 domain-containing protein [Lachnospiraceae bacterium]